MKRVLLVTNDFPPKQGGIESYVYGMASRLYPEELVVYCSTSPGAAEFDASVDFDVVRADTSVLLPTPKTARTAAKLARRHDCDVVWFGAAAPLGLLASGLKRRTGIRHAVALTHGHEAAWAALPGARAALRRIARGVDVTTYLGEYTRERLEPIMGESTLLRRLTFGVDTVRFSPSVDGKPVRARHGLTDRRVICCVSRLVPRKGQDVLIRALPRIQRAVPDAALLLAGVGPYQARLQRLARKLEVADDVVFAGAVPQQELPAYYAAADVFAMPCRTRRRGLDFEGLGAVYMEAASTGLPVVVGGSGGAPEAVRDGETGHVVDGQDVSGTARRLAELLVDSRRRQAFGEAGREWMQKEWSWPQQAARMRMLLDYTQH